MTDVRLDMATINDGSLFRDFEAAILKVTDSLSADPDLKGPRQISVKITFTPEDRFIRTAHSVDTRTPTRARTGVAWVSERNGAELRTDNEFNEGDGRQLDLVKFVSKRTSADD